MLLELLFKELVNGNGTIPEDVSGVSSMSLAMTFNRVCIPCEDEM